MTALARDRRLPVEVPDVVEVLDGPFRVGSERRWRARLADGRHALLAMLLEELAADPSLRRRWVRDFERLREFDAPAVARVLAMGPSPDPRDPNAVPPWRLREDPRGETLHDWLERRAPAPVDEVVELVASLADAVHGLHVRGVVLRDLHPRNILRKDDGSVVLTDIGLARVDILSTRTAASLLLEGSPYASPEQLTRTAVDGRSDVYALGVILFQGLTGVLPFGESPSIFREADAEPPSPRELRAEIPENIDAVCRRCLAYRSDLRPDSAAELAEILRGEATLGERSLARVQCQACGAALRPAQRLCLSCGRAAVVFAHADDDTTDLYALTLTKVEESAELLARLREFLSAVAEGPLPPLNFLIGDARMYSKQEQKRLIRLPARLLDRLPRQTAVELERRMKALGFAIKASPVRPNARPLPRSVTVGFGIGAVATFAGATILAALGMSIAAGVTIALAGIMTLVAVVVGVATKRAGRPRTSLLRLREAPAALPASDPLVARLGALLRDDTPDDVREQIGEMALLVQRLCDHRITHAGERAEIDAVTEPVSQIVERVEAEVARLRKVDAALSELDEGTLVRALAASTARGEPASARDELLAGLDRLRALEEARAAVLQRLLDASSLMRRSIELGLSVRDPAVTHERNVALALAALAPDR